METRDNGGRSGSPSGWRGDAGRNAPAPERPRTGTVPGVTGTFGGGVVGPSNRQGNGNTGSRGSMGSPSPTPYNNGGTWRSGTTTPAPGADTNRTPTRPGPIYRRGTDNTTADRPGSAGTPTRPGPIYRRGTDNTPDRPGSVGAPNRPDTRPPASGISGSGSQTGGINPRSSRSTGTRREPVAGWRAPRVSSSASSGRSAPLPSWRQGEVRHIDYRSTRPHAVTHRNWHDRDYWRHSFHTVDLGWYDPWNCYTSPGWLNVRFYYPYYYTGTWRAGFYYAPFGYYNGWFPSYIYPERVVVIERRIYLRDVVDDGGYYDPYGSYSQASLSETMDNIKIAWLDGDGGRLLQHINQSIPVRVYQKGEYKYSLEAEDYRDLTKDALNRVDTTGFEWTRIDRRSNDEVYVEARHTFRDPDGDRHVVRLSYTLEKARGGWWITETGSAPDTLDL